MADTAMPAKTRSKGGPARDSHTVKDESDSSTVVFTPSVARTSCRKPSLTPPTITRLPRALGVDCLASRVART